MATSRLSSSEPASNPAEPAALVLVGGQSSRMGADKASLVVDGIALRDRVLQVVAQAGIEQVVVVGGSGVPDAPSHSGQRDSQGPLAGIVGGWHALQNQAEPHCGPTVVLACDLPWLESGVVRKLVQACPQHTHGVVAHDGERPQPLIAAYHPIALDAMVHCFDAGERSLRRCSKGWDLGVIFADPKVIADADTPDDLAGFVVEWPE